VTVFTSHHITKLIAEQRVAQLQAEAAPKRPEAGERRLVRRARRLVRIGRRARPSVASRPTGLAPGSPEG
jgi:hypothetical protein